MFVKKAFTLLAALTLLAVPSTASAWSFPLFPSGGWFEWTKKYQDSCQTKTDCHDDNPYTQDACVSKNFGTVDTPVWVKNCLHTDVPCKDIGQFCGDYDYRCLLKNPQKVHSPANPLVCTHESEFAIRVVCGWDQKVKFWSQAHGGYLPTLGGSEYILQKGAMCSLAGPGGGSYTFEARCVTPTIQTEKPTIWWGPGWYFWGKYLRFDTGDVLDECAPKA